MIKNIIYLFCFLISTEIFSQNDSIVNYIDKNGKKISNFYESKFIEFITKQSDSLWMTKIYKRDEKISSYWFSKTTKNNIKIGQFVSFDSNDSISEIKFYNENGLKHGKITTWYINRNKNFEGRYVNGTKEGAWSYYHYNGKLATKNIYKNDSIVKSFYFNDGGLQIDKYENLKKNPYFRGGENSFKNKLENIFLKYVNNIPSGKIEISLVIGIDGSINYIDFYPKFQNNIEQEIIKSISKIKGWKPGINNGRIVPVTYTNEFTIRKND